MKRTGAAAAMEEGSGCRCKHEKGAEEEAAAETAEEEGKIRARRCVEEVAEHEVVMSVRVPLTVAAIGDEARSGSEGRGRNAVRAIRSMLKMKARSREV
jgi:hypothetical protein